MDWKLELVLVPVADVDRAKAFYTEKMGFVLDVDHRGGENFRVVQVTPPGSACSISFGIGITTAKPGSVVGLHLVVSDIEAAHAELIGRGVAVDPIRHMTSDGWQPGPTPSTPSTTRSPSSRTRTATPGCCRRCAERRYATGSDPPPWDSSFCSVSRARRRCSSARARSVARNSSSSSGLVARRGRAGRAAQRLGGLLVPVAAGDEPGDRADVGQDDDDEQPGHLRQVAHVALGRGDDVDDAEDPHTDGQ